MAEIDRYRPDDRRQVEALYRRVFGPDAADANRLRWDWQYRRNPNVAADGPLIWLAREGSTVVGQYATMPVRLSLGGREIDASWGMDVMVAPERQRQGLGDALVSHVGPPHRRRARPGPVGGVSRASFGRWPGRTSARCPASSSR